MKLESAEFLQLRARSSAANGLKKVLQGFSFSLRERSPRVGTDSPSPPLPGFLRRQSLAPSAAAQLSPARAPKPLEEAKALEWVEGALAEEAPLAPARPALATPPVPMPPRAELSPAQQEARARMATVQAMVEKIELWLQAHRPALTLTLRTGGIHKVEVERTGEGQVALKLHGRGGFPPPEDVARLRDALYERGVKLSYLSLA